MNCRQLVTTIRYLVFCALKQRIIYPLSESSGLTFGKRTSCGHLPLMNSVICSPHINFFISVNFDFCWKGTIVQTVIQVFRNFKKLYRNYFKLAHTLNCLNSKIMSFITEGKLFEKGNTTIGLQSDNFCAHKDIHLFICAGI